MFVFNATPKLFLKLFLAVDFKQFCTFLSVNIEMMSGSREWLLQQPPPALTSVPVENNSDHCSSQVAVGDSEETIKYG